MNVLPSQFALLRRSLDMAAENHRVIGQNVANANTPDYQAQEAVFDRSLEKLIEGGEGAVERATIRVRPTGDPTSRRDGNNVDIDRELGKLNKNALMFRAYTELLQTRLSQMTSAMKLR